MPPSKHPKWIPKSQKIAGAKPIPVPQDVVLNMSTLADKKIKVDIIHPPGGKVTHKKRGPKQKDLPVDLITQWDGEGMGSKGIAARLKKEYSITVSYKTIQRILSGQRVMV